MKTEFLMVLLHLLGMTGLVVGAYFRFKGDVQAQFAELRGDFKVLNSELGNTNRNLSGLINKDIERLHQKNADFERRLATLERKKAS